MNIPVPQEFVQQLVNGLTLGSIYALIALGYTMVYGILELINFAHGEIFMVGGFLGLLALSFFNLGGLGPFTLALCLLFAFIFAMSFSSALGMLVERLAYRPLRHAPRLAPLITAVGVSIFLQNAVMLIAGSENKTFPQIFPQGAVTLGASQVSYLQIFIMLSSVTLMACLTLFINRTRMGKAMKAVAQERRTSALMGINVNKIISLTFLIGSGLGAAAGIMVGMYYQRINFMIGYLAGLKAFTAAVLGGIGNIPGAMFGGILLGILESLGAAFITAEYKDVFAFVILIIVLIIKPSGIFGENIASD